jgi:crossover junction endodeoxyribonuclease RuvC
MNCVVGIDPGKHGGLATILSGGDPTGTWWAPSMAQVQPLDLDGLGAWLKDLDDQVDGALFVYIEDVHAMPGQGVVSMFNFGYSSGRTYGIIEGHGFPIRLVTPRTWKNSVLGPRYPHDKAGAIAFCKDWYAGINLIPPRCRVPHDGCADALAIAHYGFYKEFGHE